MKFILKLDCDNSAFTEAPAAEVARILKEAAWHLEQGTKERILFDINGNRVGQYKLDGKGGR